MTPLWMELGGRAFTLLAMGAVMFVGVQIAVPWALAIVFAFDLDEVFSLSLDDFDSECDEDEDLDADDGAWDRGHDEWMDRAVGL